MLRYLPNHQINYRLWDACVEASAQRLVYALSWYLDVVSPGWAAVVEEQEGRYLAVMPLPVHHKFSFPYVKQPFFCQQLGLFSIEKEIDSSAFLNRALEHFSFISGYNFNTHNTGQIGYLKNKNLLIKQQYTHHLYLGRSYQNIYAGYSRDRKINLKRSQKAGLKIIQSNHVDSLINLFKEDAASRIRGGVSPATYTLLQNLFRVLHNRGLATVLYTQTPTGETDAGALFLIYGNKIIYLFNAASVAGRRRNGRSLLLDHVVQQFAGSNYVFDFESPVAVDSIIRVYQGFGAEPIPFYNISYNNLPAPVKLAKSVRQFLYQQLMPTFGPKP